MGEKSLDLAGILGAWWLWWPGGESLREGERCNHSMR